MAGDRDEEKPAIALFAALPYFGNQGCNALTLSFMALAARIYGVPQTYFLHALRDSKSESIEIEGETYPMDLVNCRMSFLSAPNKNLVGIYCIAMLYRVAPGLATRMSPWIRTLAKSRVIATHYYGDSFSDLYGLARFLRYAAVCGTAIVMGRPLVLLPQTYGPFTSGWGKWVARFLIINARTVIARDESGLADIKALAPRRESSVYSPDLAFALPSELPADVSIEPALDEESAPVIGFNVSGLLYEQQGGGAARFGIDNDYRETVQCVIENLLNTTDAHIVLTPHVYSEDRESDNIAIDDVYGNLETKHRGRVHVLRGRYGAMQIKGIIGTYDFLIGSRMHSCIAALSQSIPAVGIAYSKKFTGVFASVGVEELVIDARNQTAEAIAEHCVAAFHARNTWAGTLRNTAPAAQERLYGVMDKIFSEARADVR